jgi:uncharacterized membrane protein
MSTPALPRLRTSPAVIALVVLSVPVALYALGFAWLAPDSPFKARMMSLPQGALPHFVGGGIALLVGGLQFSAALRARQPALHRLLGRVYLLAVLASGLGGLALATNAHGGVSARIGFGLLALLWLGTAMAAWRAILRHDIEAHRRWMVRSFALTFGAVMLRLQLPLLQFGLGASFDDAYRTVAWLAWVPNLLVAEWWLLAHAPSIAPHAPSTSPQAAEHPPAAGGAALTEAAAP